MSSYYWYWRKSKDIETSRDISLSLYQFLSPHIVRTEEDKDISRDVSTSLLFLQYEQYEDIQTDTTIKIYHVMFLRLYCEIKTDTTIKIYSKDVEASRDISLSLYQFVCPHIIGTEETVKT
jgi:hypothetical protein